MRPIPDQPEPLEHQPAILDPRSIWLQAFLTVTLTHMARRWNFLPGGRVPPLGSSELIERIAPLFTSTVVACSGFSSLVYQVVWDRTLRSNFGGDPVSAAVVTATFLLGLGIGAMVFGKWRANPFRLYAMIEIGIGLYGIISYYILSSMAIWLGTFFNYTITDVEGLRSVVIVACILFLLPPCILMGGTLPVIFNCFVRPDTYQNMTVGWLYGLNTAGAAAGIAAAPCLLLNRFSIPSTLMIIGLGNLALGAVVWLYGRASSPSRRSDTNSNSRSEATTAGREQLPLRPLLLLSFISGFIALSFEISLLRAVSLLMPSSPYMFPFVLMPFLLAMAIGSITFTRFKQYSVERSIQRIGILFLATMLAMLAVVWLRACVANRFYAPALVVPVPLLLGSIFPLLLRLAASHGRDLPNRTGKIYLVNSIGAFSGAMVTQFYVFPQWGTKALILVLFSTGALAGAFCLLAAPFKTNALSARSVRHITACLVLLFTLTPALVSTTSWNIYTFDGVGADFERVEGMSGVAGIRWHGDPPQGSVLVNGQYMSELPDHPKHVRLAAIALSMPEREHVLVLGLGGGGMIRELAKDTAIRHLDVVDWSFELPQALNSPRAKASLDDVFDNPKVRLFHADARVAVSLYAPRTFDVVIDNLAAIGWAGSTSVKSLAYFQAVKRILKPTGVFVFDPNYSRSPAREAVLAGLMQNFASVQEHEKAAVIIASSAPPSIDHQRAERLMAARAEMLNLSEPYAYWLLRGFKTITARDLKGTAPIIDELLIYEFRKFGILNTDKY